MLKLSGKTALVTGAESGIGRAIAIQLAANGANVIITYIKDEAGAFDTLTAVKHQGSNGLILQVDVRQPESVQALFTEALTRYGRINILVNSAGIRSVDKHIQDISYAEFELTVSVNLFGTFLCCQQFVKQWPAAGDGGRIINISSIHEQVVSAGKVDYCASKWALGGFSRALALEVADKGITVNNIAPGMILTPMNKQAVDDENYRAAQEKRIPMKVAGLPLDVAKVAVFLASEDAAYITGTTQVVDGGLTLNRAAGSK